MKTQLQHLRNHFLTTCAAVALVELIHSVSAAPFLQAHLKAATPRFLENFGNSVAVSEDTLVVGAPGNLGVDSGPASVYTRTGTNWAQQASLYSSNATPFSWFGFSAAVSGDTAVIGAPFDQGIDTGVFHGSVFIFVRDGTNWVEQAHLRSSWSFGGEKFGMSVAISGDTVVVGAWEEGTAATGVNSPPLGNAGSSGAAYVFVRSATNWSQQAYLKASNTGAGDYFGRSVGVSGDTIVVGAFGEDSNAIGINGDQADNSATNAGAAYVFVRDGTNWSQQAYLKGSTSQSEDEFGFAVAVSGQTIVVGANQEDVPSPDARGLIYVFERAGTNWAQQARLDGFTLSPYTYYLGVSVSLSGNTLVAGADLLAYIFVRTGSIWTLQPFPEPEPEFDASTVAVSVFGGTLVVGANDEIGISNDDSTRYAGAAYVFAGFGLGPQISFERDGVGGYFVRLNGITGFTYQLQRAPSVTGPWVTNATMAVSVCGRLEFHDTNALPGQAFYRVEQR